MHRYDLPFGIAHWALMGFMLISSLVPTFASPAPASAAGDCTVPAASAAVDATELQFLQQLNVYRAANNAPAVEQSGSLRVAATWMSLDQAKRNTMPPDHVDTLGRSIATRFADCGYTGFQGTFAFWENICCGGTNNVDTADEVFNVWKNSPQHNEAMLRPNVKFVGVARECTAAKCYWTLTLGTNPSGTTDVIPAGAAIPPGPVGGPLPPVEVPPGPVGAPPPGGAGNPVTGQLVQQGANGENVTAIQYLLRHAGAEIEIDGDFGPQTSQLLKEFQAKSGLPTDGIVGPETWNKLWVTVQQGDLGDPVSAAQTLLVWHALDISVDGDFGPVTDGAVRTFQTRKNLVIDGQVGPQTWTALVNK